LLCSQQQPLRSIAQPTRIHNVTISATTSAPENQKGSLTSVLSVSEHTSKRKINFVSPTPKKFQTFWKEGRKAGGEGSIEAETKFEFLTS
jgi:hypothetical protein